MKIYRSNTSKFNSICLSEILCNILENNRSEIVKEGELSKREFVNGLYLRSLKNKLINYNKGKSYV